MYSLSVQCVVLLDPARQNPDVSLQGFVDIADRRVNVLDHLQQVSDVSAKLIDAAHPSARDLVDCLNVFRSCSDDRLGVLSVDEIEILSGSRLQCTAHVKPPFHRLAVYRDD